MTLAMERPAQHAASLALRPSEVDGLVRAHLPLVHHLVREVARRVPNHVDRSDLTSAAMYALVTSARSFDPSLGAAFGTFASIRIRGALTDELRSMDWASRGARGKARAVDTARNELTNRLGRSPFSDEVAQALNLSVREVATVEADVHRATVLSLNALTPECGVDSVAEQSDGPESLLLRREQVGYLRDAVAELPERLRMVVEQYYFGQRKMANIAAELGVTESRVSQLRSEALALLRDGLKLAVDGTAPSLPTIRRGAAQEAAHHAYCTAIATRSTIAGRLAATSLLGERRSDRGSSVAAATR